MYHVPKNPHPAPLSFVLGCVWFGARYGAIYGLVCGASYGIFFYGYGLLVGAPVGLLLGLLLGALDGLICGLLLRRSSAILRHTFDLKLWISALSFFLCFTSGCVTLGIIGIDQRLPLSLFVFIPALIASVGTFLGTGRLLHWYSRGWSAQPPNQADTSGEHMPR